MQTGLLGSSSCDQDEQPVQKHFHSLMISSFGRLMYPKIKDIRKV